MAGKRITCPDCGNKIPVERPGQVVVCDNCGKKLKVAAKKKPPHPAEAPTIAPKSAAPPAAQPQPKLAPETNAASKGGDTPAPPPDPLTMPGGIKLEPVERVLERTTDSHGQLEADQSARLDPLTMPPTAASSAVSPFEHFGEQFEEGDVGEIKTMSGFDPGRVDDAALSAQVGGLRDIDPTGIQDSSSAQIGGLEDIIQLQTKRAETDAVEVDEADLSAYDHPEQ
ncbi:MAG: hypothetical protein P9M14_01120, partial [Candidatus Alcyoniella australis]|nr:hypothetical protein [Candidatus Alcyoniella australis]